MWWPLLKIFLYGSDEPRKGRSVMAKKVNVKKLTKELINKGYMSKSESFSDMEIIEMHREMLINEMTAEVKEECTMETKMVPNVTNDNTMVKEEIHMTKKERIQDVARRIEEFTKTSDEGYVTKEEMAELIFDCMGGAKPSIRKYKRAQLIETIMIMAGKDKESTSVPVGDLEITRDNASVQEDNHNNAKAKTDKLFALIKACAIDNQKKGFGYTISSYMLQACILNAGADILKLKGHTVTEEEAKMTQEVYKWLKDKGFVQPLVYSVVEDENIRVYRPEYTGSTNTKNVKMIPWNKSKGYTAKKVTSFAVAIK